MRQKGNKNVVKAGGLLSLIVVGFTVGLLYLGSVGEVVVEETITAKWHRLPYVGDGDPGGDNSGFMVGRAYPHQAAPAVAYAVNLTNDNSYEHSDTINTTMTNETPHSTTFDLVLKFRVNDTVNYNVSDSSWEPSWILANATVDFDWAADVPWTTMTLVEIDNNTNFCWYHAYLNNGGAGYQIAQNEGYNWTFNVSAWW